MDFRKIFNTVPKNNLWNRLEELKVPLELRVVAMMLYAKFIAKFKSTKGWSKDINCNIGVKQGCPLSPTLFGIYIDKLERCLEEANCTGTTLAGIVIILLLYVDDIVLLARIPSHLHRQLRFLNDLCSNMGMSVNTDKTKVMIIKSKKDTYANCFYDNNNLEEVSSYKYFRININHKLNWNYNIEKKINGGWKDYFGLENNCKSTNLVMWDKKNSFLKLSSPLLSCTLVKFGVAASLKNPRERLSKFKSVLSCITSKLRAIRPILFSS